MKKLRFIILFGCSLATMAQKSTSDSLIYSTTDIWPSYPKGYQALFHSFAQVLMYQLLKFQPTKTKIPST